MENDKTSVKAAGNIAMSEIISADGAVNLNIANIFFESKIFGNIESAAQAYVKILAGREIGLNPIQAMNSVYIVEGKIAYESKIFLAAIKKSKTNDYKIKKMTDEECEIEFYENGELQGKSTFTAANAAAIGLINKPMYKNYPALMLFYRAASLGVKMYCPQILDGNAIYEDYVELTEKPVKTGMRIDLNSGDIKKIETGEAENGK
ncbi:MAG: hypothetical protein LBT79_00730 [Elusimicrobiota bacterium]|jgi:hypothetical protein|nr:hypothetical protein [Elusimicrobiota bacterium]